MATEDLGKCLTFVAGEALTSDQFKIVKLDANGAVVKAAAVTDRPIGVLQNSPASGGAAEVCVSGLSKLVFGGSIAMLGIVASDAAGKGTALTVAASGTTYNYAVGEVTQIVSAADGIGQVFVFGGGQPILV